MFKKNEKIWNSFVEKNNEQGFTKCIIPKDYLSLENPISIFGFTKTDFFAFTYGIWLNYKDKLIRFIEGESDCFITIPFQLIYDVGIDVLNISKTKGWAIGDAVVISSSTTKEHLKSMCMQIIVKDPNGGVQTIELIILPYRTRSYEEGKGYANAYEKCATAMMYEISDIIDKYCCAE